MAMCMHKHTTVLLDQDHVPGLVVVADGLELATQTLQGALVGLEAACMGAVWLLAS